MTFRTRTFLGVFLTSALALAVATLLVERSLREFTTEDIGASLLGQARLVAYLVERQAGPIDLDAEADALGAELGARVTLIAADGTVLGDSAVAGADLATVENHRTRPEVETALRLGEAVSDRTSRTTNVDTLYAAVGLSGGRVAVVRVAVPLGAVDARTGEVRRLALVGLAVGLVVAAVLTVVASVVLNRRLRVLADTAHRYDRGDFSRPSDDDRRDEIGKVADVLDRTVRELGTRLEDLGRDRAHRDAILTGMVEGVVLVDATGHLVLTNPAVRAMLRLPEPAEGRHYIEVVRQPDLARQVAAALAGVPTAPIEVRLDREPPRTVIANVVPVARGSAGGAVIVLHDITDLKHADQVRRDFVANVSHELRTPLTAIRGYVEAMLDATDPADTRPFLEIIERHARRMERLVHDLLRLARLDAGQETIARAPCGLADVISGVLRDLEVQVGAKQQRVDVQFASDAGVVSGDAAKLHDVFRNLVENAVNYGPAGGTITIASTQSDDGQVRISVADQGPGIPEAELTRVFERFYRVDRSRSRDPGGTGLGLSIVRHLVELHGGTASVRNRPGGGAEFTVTLPAG